MRIFAALLLASLPLGAFAAGEDDAAPPTPTETTTTCSEGEVWDPKTKACIAPEDSSLNDDLRFRAVRELAYADRPEAALRVLAAMNEGDSDRVLTYKGFANRKAGRLEVGLALYRQALARNPDNILARSYLGQAFVEIGELALAQTQLDEIRARGGAGSWAEASLARALATGQTLSY